MPIRFLILAESFILGFFLTYHCTKELQVRSTLIGNYTGKSKPNSESETERRIFCLNSSGKGWFPRWQRGMSSPNKPSICLFQVSLIRVYSEFKTIWTIEEHSANLYNKQIIRWLLSPFGLSSVLVGTNVHKRLYTYMLSRGTCGYQAGHCNFLYLSIRTEMQPDSKILKISEY